jgi:hypothetical protein
VRALYSGQGEDHDRELGVTPSRFSALVTAFRECIDLAEAELAALEHENFLLTIQRDESRLQVESLQRLLIEQSAIGSRSGNLPQDFGPEHCKHCGDTFTKRGPQEKVCPPCRTTMVTKGAERAREGRAAARAAASPDEEVVFS